MLFKEVINGTRENIINAFFKLAVKNRLEAKNITLSDVAKEAGISRQAIYQKHFSSVDDIVNEIHNLIDNDIYKEFSKVLKNNNSRNDIYELIAHSLLPLLYEKRVWLHVLYHTSADASWREFLVKKYSSLIVQNFSDKIDNNSPMSDYQIIDIICEYIVAIISIWLSEEFPEPPSKFAKKFLELVRNSSSDLVIFKP